MSSKRTGREGRVLRRPGSNMSHVLKQLKVLGVFRRVRRNFAYSKQAKFLGRQSACQGNLVQDSQRIENKSSRRILDKGLI